MGEAVPSVSILQTRGVQELLRRNWRSTGLRALAFIHPNHLPCKDVERCSRHDGKGEVRRRWQIDLGKSHSQPEELTNMNADRRDIIRVTDKMNKFLYQEEMTMWLQRSRISWLKEGDRNTNFFQSKAVWRER